jgi:beta-lactamase class A
VAFQTLDGGRIQWLRLADEPFHAASTMKVAVLIELYRQARQGRVRLDEPLTIRNEVHSLLDGSVFTLDPNDDSEKELYRAFGETRTLGQLSETPSGMMLNQDSVGGYTRIRALIRRSPRSFHQH